MDKKKLIGAIVGVLLFATLVAGATFAWLTYSATITNGTISNITSRNFTFTSPTGTNITGLRSLGSQRIRNGFSGGVDYVALSLSKAAGTPYASSVKIIMRKPVNGITLANAFKYAVCRSNTAASCDNSVSTAIPSSTSTADWVVVNGSITTGTDDQVLWEDTASAIGTSTTGSPFNVTGAVTGYSYYIYFWLDNDVITTEAEREQVNGKTIQGNLFFEAIQGE